MKKIKRDSKQILISLTVYIIIISVFLIQNAPLSYSQLTSESKDHDLTGTWESRFDIPRHSDRDVGNKIYIIQTDSEIIAYFEDTWKCSGTDKSSDIDFTGFITENNIISKVTTCTYGSGFSHDYQRFTITDDGNELLPMSIYFSGQYGNGKYVKISDDIESPKYSIEEKLPESSPPSSNDGVSSFINTKNGNFIDLSGIWNAYMKTEYEEIEGTVYIKTDNNNIEISRIEFEPTVGHCDKPDSFMTGTISGSTITGTHTTCYFQGWEKSLLGLYNDPIRLTISDDGNKISGEAYCNSSEDCFKVHPYAYSYPTVFTKKSYDLNGIWERQSNQQLGPQVSVNIQHDKDTNDVIIINENCIPNERLEFSGNLISGKDTIDGVESYCTSFPTTDPRYSPLISTAYHGTLKILDNGNSLESVGPPSVKYVRTSGGGDGFGDQEPSDLPPVQQPMDEIIEQTPRSPFTEDKRSHDNRLQDFQNILDKNPTLMGEENNETVTPLADKKINQSLEGGGDNPWNIDSVIKILQNETSHALSENQSQLGKQKNFTLIVTDNIVDIANQSKYNTTTFNGTIPGPLITINQGDILQIKLINNASKPHSLKSQLGISVNQTQTALLKPSETETKRIVAAIPGTFMYYGDHADMYGPIIVKPENITNTSINGIPVVFSELYRSDQQDGNTSSFSLDKYLSNQPDHILVNALSNYNDIHNETVFDEKTPANQIIVKPDEITRLYIFNAGPRNDLTLDIDNIFKVVYHSAETTNHTQFKNAVTLPVKTSTIIETLFPQGLYNLKSSDPVDVLKGGIMAIKSSSISDENHSNSIGLIPEKQAKTFELDLGNSTYPIHYFMNNGEISNMSLFANSGTLDIKIQNAELNKNDSKLLIELPRNILDSSSEAMGFYPFIVKINNISASKILEIPEHDDRRVLLINYTGDTDEIQIKGNKVLNLEVVNYEQIRKLNEQVINLLIQGSYDGALEIVDRSLGLNDSILQSVSLEGFLTSLLNDTERSDNAFIKAHSLAADNNTKKLGIYNLQGLASSIHGDNEKALDFYDKALTLDPTIADTHYNKAVSYYELGRYGEAEMAIDKALEIDSQNKKYLDAKQEILSSQEISFIELFKSQRTDQENN